MAERSPATVTRLSVKVIAGSSRSVIAGWSGGRLRVRIGAVAEGGKANAALIALMAKALDLPKSAVRVVSGATSPLKTLEISTLSEAAVVARLGVKDEK